MLAFLGEKKIAPEKKARVKENLPFNQTLTIEIGDGIVTLGFAAAKHIFVDIVNP